MNERAARRLEVSIGAAVRPIAGEAVAGDAFARMPWDRGVLVALADGLGHGPRAAVASHAFLRSVAEHASESFDKIFVKAHRDLAKTRGAVAAIARFDEERGEVEIAGIGNITTVIARAAGRPAHPIPVPGVIGSAFRTVRPEQFQFGLGDFVVMHSDGVRSRFELAGLGGLSPQSAALEVLRTGAKASDDAACVIARAVAFSGATRGTEPLPGVRAALASRAIPVRIAGDAECVAIETRAFGERVGLTARAMWEASIAATELATNILKFAGHGVLALRHIKAPREALEIEATDQGAGIRDVLAAQTDGYSEGAWLTADRPRHARQGLGVGLGSVHRMMDRVDVESAPGRGTRIVALKYR